MSDNGATTLLLARHGETEWSRTGQHTGLTDVQLTGLGERQATALGARLRRFDLSAVWTSPLDRAADTCRLAGFGDVAQRVDDLVEWDYGAYEGRTTVDIREDVPGWTVWTHGVPDGETAAAVGARADRVVHAARDSGGTIALFSHGHFLRVLAARWLGLAASEGRLLALSTATFSELGYEREQPVVRLWNDDSHFTSKH